MIDSETPISGVQLGSTPIPLKIKASNINSESATQGQALLADGQGGASWGDIQEKLTTTNIPSGTIDESIGFDNLGNVVRGSAGGGNQLYLHSLKFSNDVIVNITDSESSQYTNATFCTKYNGAKIALNGFFRTSTFGTNKLVYGRYLLVDSNSCTFYSGNINFGFDTATNLPTISSVDKLGTQGGWTLQSDSVTPL